LGDILQLANINIEETVFFGGSIEDVRFFEDAGYNIQILNRFEGPHARISATEVRDALVLSKPLDGLIHPTIEPELKELFQKKWENFKKI
jgi:hypothetical protein